jgi:peptide/nickel transport system ATP-binding protein
MNQRVMIAQALACDPDLLIADEPTTALDVTIQARILELIRELQARHDAAVLYITHDLSLVRGLCDRVNVMYAGRIVETADTSELFGDPLHPYTRGLLAAMPAQTAARGRLSAIDGSVGQITDDAVRCTFSDRCPHAGAVCDREKPGLAPDREPGHRVACFLHNPPDGADPEALPAREPRA